MADALYPKRPPKQVFACRFVRLLTKKCVANELGPSCFTLLTVIAHQEDARGYTDAVTFYNHQLMPLVGLGSVDTLDRVRQKAIEAGWLNYTPGGRGVPGRYFVTVPERYRGTDDAPSDEGGDSPIIRTGAEVTAEVTAEQSTGASPIIRTGAEQARLQVRNKHDYKCGTLIPVPVPNTPPTPAVVVGSVCEPLTAEPEPIGPSPAAVAAHWNSHPGLLQCVGSDPHRDRIIRTWALDHPLWTAHWRAAITFMGRTPFYCGGGERGWRPDLGWFLKNDNFAGVVERMLAEHPRSPPPAAEFKPVIKRPDDNPLASLERLKQNCPPM